ncbi:uncharacterized protein G2W53_002142 [Senna tora]|uniref:Uncharacterized protein n=1 Tax=Senna tora TaxID=362788 RepID=A0A835CN71_9FABA|nr:uncharacterized protein G2W53_002142 [Senna tora]
MRNSKAHDDQHQVLSQKSSKTTTSFQMKEDDKFFSRLLSKEESSNKSFRLSLAIPFQSSSNNKNSTSFINDLSSSLAVSFRVVPMAKLGRRRRLLSFGSSSSSSFDFRGGDDDCGSHNSSTSMCFGGVHPTNSCSRRA